MDKVKHKATIDEAAGRILVIALASAIALVLVAAGLLGAAWLWSLRP